MKGCIYGKVFILHATTATRAAASRIGEMSALLKKGLPMVIVLIRRSVWPDKEEAFLKKYKSQTPIHNADFISEYLTKVGNLSELPESMRSLHITGPGITYVNVAFWRSTKSFEKEFNPETKHDPEIECGDRVRIVLDVVNSVER